MNEREDTISDEEIVRRIRGGETALFELLMRRHNQRIYRAVRAILRSDDGTEDAMQQAWLNAYQHLGQFAGQAQFSTWLTRIAVNEALARLRKSQREITEGEEAMSSRLVDTETPDPERHAGTKELRDVLEREIAALPSAFQVVLVMRDIEGMSTAESAEALGISDELVRTRLHRARAMLRENLDRRAGVTMASLFTFGNQRCDRLVSVVMNTIIATNGSGFQNSSDAHDARN